MFLVSDISTSREERILKFLKDDPAIAALLSIVHFEWTLRRTIIALGTSPNVEVRQHLDGCHGLKRYKEAWKKEVLPRTEKRLTEVIQNWEGLERAFRLRHRLVHGVSSCDDDYASDRANWAISAAIDLRTFCEQHNVDIDARLPVRRRTNTNTLLRDGN